MAKWSESRWSAEELIGGQPPLDFVNTAGGRTKQRDVERLTDYDVLLGWSVVAGTLLDEECRVLKSTRFGETDRETELQRVRRFREALHACLMSEQASIAWPAEDAADVHREIAETLKGSSLVKGEDHYHWRSELDHFGLALPRARLALAVEALLRSDDLSRLRNCDRCSWLFIDRGRGRPRRWCSMDACGSRAKSARYYRRSKGKT